VARISRAVAPGLPHHVTQRGNRRQQTFFSDEDYRAYIDLMHEWCTRYSVAIWGYCLMPNHIHLVAVPETEDGLALAIGEAHRRHTRLINFREGWRGHLWQGRFSSYAMDEQYLLACIRYVELNPVRAKLVATPTEWCWSSARAHAAGCDDSLVTTAPLCAMVGMTWEEFLSVEPSELDVAALHRHEHSGRPLGAPGFLDRVENQLERTRSSQTVPARSLHRTRGRLRALSLPGDTMHR